MYSVLRSFSKIKCLTEKNIALQISLLKPTYKILKHLGSIRFVLTYKSL